MTTQVRAYRAGLSAVPSGGTKVRAYRAGLASAAVSTRVRAYRAGVQTATPTNPRTQVRAYRGGLSTTVGNQGPIVGVGGDQTVESGQSFTLKGTDQDVDGQVVSRAWWRLAGPLGGATLLGVDPFLTQLAPIVAADTALTYSYTATDDDGDTTVAQTTVTVRRTPLLAPSGKGFVIVRGPQAADGAMPTSEPAGFTRVYSEDFLTPAARGSFVPGDGTPTAVGRLPTSHPYYASLNVYPDNNGYSGDLGNGRYYTSKVLAALTGVPNANGVLDSYLHSETVDGVMRALSSWIRPIVKGETSQKRLYGRFSCRMRCDPIAGYGLARVLIDDNTVKGEQDYPEGPFTSPIGGFQHFTDTGQRPVSGGGALWQDWHVFTSLWTPGRLVWLLDESAVLLDTTDRVSAVPMKHTFQSGINGDVVPDPSAAGHLQIDWITIADWTG